MADHDRPAAADAASGDAVVELTRKLDTVAGALAAIAGSHHELLGHVAEAESRRSHDAREAAQRLGALERQILGLPAQVAEAVQRLDHRTAERRTEAPELHAVLTARDERQEAQLAALTSGLAHHTDLALAGALRVIDARLAALRDHLSVDPAGQGNVTGFEAGAVMGAAQAAWTRLEQRLDAAFDELGRQLRAMTALMERTAATTEAVANRPVVTGDQLRRAAAAVKESVTSAGRTRRDRRGGQRGLGPGG